MSRLVQNQSATITSTGVVFTLDARTFGKGHFKHFAVIAKGTGAAPTTLTAAVEASIDGTNFTSIQAVTEANNGATLFVVDKPCLVVRVNVTALTLGSATNVVFSLLAVD